MMAIIKIGKTYCWCVGAKNHLEILAAGSSSSREWALRAARNFIRRNQNLVYG